MGMRDSREIVPTDEQNADQGNAPAPYAPPGAVGLGKTRNLILGYWDEGWADYSSKYKHAGE